MLSSPIDELTRLTHVQRAALDKLGLRTIRDLLYHIPARYESSADVRTIEQTHDGQTVTIYGQFTKLEMKRSFKTKVPMAEGSFTDGTGTLRIVWFHQPYLAKMVPTNELVRLRGTLTVGKGKKYIANPTVEKAAGIPILENPTGLMPVYPESAGVTSLWFYHALKRVFEEGILSEVEETLPEEILEKYHLPTLETALIWAHQPKTEKDAEAARKRFAFEEVFLIQLARGLEKEKNKERRALPVDADEERVAAFMRSFPFEATDGQKKAIADIMANFLEPYPMARLLEGDVGSGKTAVAAATAYAVVTSRPRNAKGEIQKDFGNLQVAYMCPTEILAKQHFATFTSFFKKHPIQIGLITSSGCYKYPSKVNPNDATPISRPQLLKWVANGEIPILIGTHALIQKSVMFKHLAYVIIDEQHRFGTFQRAAIATKGGVAPHLLSMTATPIPRTLALTIFGDLDLTILDQMPLGRKAIKTEIAPPTKRPATYAKVRELLEEGRQAYVICPRIDEPDPSKQLALQSRSVAAETKSLQKIFPEYVVEKLHSKMTPKEKEDVMGRFEKGLVHILVATSVVEVGVNVPNATIILIEGAERFGLAQLHQLRGRVMRSSYQPYCFLMVDKASSANNERLKAIVSAKNGFELAEKDLEIRGAGELYGRRQWGLSDIGMEALKNLKLVEAARTEASALIQKDPTLEKHVDLKARALETIKDLHFE
jgi:ATP-dependent DNA helicase RecG